MSVVAKQMNTPSDRSAAAAAIVGYNIANQWPEWLIRLGAVIGGLQLVTMTTVAIMAAVR